MQPARTPFPYVDGLTFISPADFADVSRSGLSAFICDVSSASDLKSEDGSLRFWRSFEPCVRSMTAMRRDVQAEKVPGTFLTTRGSEIAEAWKDGRTAVFFQIQGGGEAVGEELWRLDAFHELGLRVFQITHHNDNPWGGGAIEKTCIPELNNIRRMVLIHEALDRAGFKTARVEKIMGGNWIRVLTESL